MHNAYNKYDTTKSAVCKQTKIMISPPDSDFQNKKISQRTI